MTPAAPQILKLAEHDKLKNAKPLSSHTHESAWASERSKELLNHLRDNLNDKTRYFNMDHQGEIGYYIGVDWLCLPGEKSDMSASAGPASDTIPALPTEGIALLATPKIEGIDWITMFLECLWHPKIFTHLQKCYAISIDLPPVSLPKDESVDVTPLLLVHYVAVLRRIVSAGLKRGYVTRQENLSSKIKGKLMLGKTISKNRCAGRDDRNYCRYQDYTVDCTENRILKCAFGVANRWLRTHKDAWSNKERDNDTRIQESLGHCQAALAEVSDDIDVRNTEHLRINPLYRDYAEALKLARTILRRFHYSFQDTSDDEDERKVPPFWIDMPKLFELYAYSKLHDKYKEKILFQEHGKYGYTDFLKTDECMIIDTKYKKIYNKDKRYDIKDIRQLSGYARDINIRKKLGIHHTTHAPSDNHTDLPVPHCLILYPQESKENTRDLKLPDSLIHPDPEDKLSEKFVRMYTYPLPVPIKHPDNKK